MVKKDYVMKKNILITGANGFIGKNLVKALSIDNNYIILTFTRDNTEQELFELLNKTDYIVHLAGEVRPDSSDDDFQKSNIGLTRLIVDYLSCRKLSVPIILASTIHAQLLKNEYGKTKREAELLVEKYASEFEVNCNIFRLPHVFGEGCKPNYNSVITTWINNIIQGDEIVIYDRAIPMTYVYVQDVVKDFIDIIVESNDNLYLSPAKTYDTTLGEVADYLKSFESNSQVLENEFQKKLYNTFCFYKKGLML